MGIPSWSNQTIRAIGSVLAGKGQQSITLDGICEMRDEILTFDHTSK